MENLAAQLLVLESSIAAIPAGVNVDVTIRLPVGTPAPEGYELHETYPHATWYLKQIENESGLVMKSIKLRISHD